MTSLSEQSAKQPPIQVTSLATASHRQLTSRTGESFSQSHTLVRDLDAQGLFVHHEVLHPGHRASLPHRHSTTEETLIILEGALVLMLDDEVYPLSADDVCVLPAGGTQKHCVVNNSDHVGRFLSIGTNLRDDEVLYR